MLERRVRSVNADAQLRLMADGVTEENEGGFLPSVNVCVDVLGFLLIRRGVWFCQTQGKGLPSLTVAHVGIGVVLVYFDPEGMRFEAYFPVERHSTGEQYARFIPGLSPSMMNRDYLVAPEAVNFQEKRGPSTVMACDLCAGVMGAAVLMVCSGVASSRLRHGECISTPTTKR